MSKESLILMIFLLNALVPIIEYLTDPGKARGCATNTVDVHSFINVLSKAHIPHLALRHRQAKMVEMVILVIKKTMFNKVGHSKSQKNIKIASSVQNFAERVDSTYWWSLNR